MKAALLIIAMFFSVQCFGKVTLNKQNVCTLDSVVDSNSMKALKLCLVNKVAIRRGRNYPIYLYIQSPGGSIYDGLRFIEFAKSIKNLHTVTEFAASMAAAIVQAVPGKRYVTSNGVLMFHRASGSFSGQFEHGELESRLNLWKTIVRNMEKMQARRIGISLDEYKKRRMNEWWIYGDDNIKQNTADKVEQFVCTHKLIQSKYKGTVRSIFGSREVIKSACPLVN